MMFSGWSNNNWLAEYELLIMVVLCSWHDVIEFAQGGINNPIVYIETEPCLDGVTWLRVIRHRSRTRTQAFCFNTQQSL